MIGLRDGLAGENWISACDFVQLSDHEVLKEVFRRVDQQASQGKTPVVLLDLDSTLYEVSTRTHQILNEWLQSSESAEFSKFRSRVAELTLDQVKYSVRDTFLAFGNAEYSKPDQLDLAIESAQRFWSERFFTDGHLVHDRAYSGASAFVQDLHRRGVEIVYLTGRDEPNMGKGTRRNLSRDGFPWEVERTHLLMKPSFHHLDLDFKKSAVQYLRQAGQLIASFENEPPNLAALAQIFPDAMHVFVDTVCSDHPALPLQGIYRLRNFE